MLDLAATIGIYGAGLSTLLALWQFWRAFQERRWIGTSYNFRGIEDPGNEVLLINNSPKPLTLFQIDLFWGRRYLLWVRRYHRVGQSEWSGEDSDLGITLEPYKIVALCYTNDTHFDWTYKKRPNARLYLRARVVGRLFPMTLFVYRQNPWNRTFLKSILSRLGFDVGLSNIYIDECNEGLL